MNHVVMSAFVQMVRKIVNDSEPGMIRWWSYQRVDMWQMAIDDFEEFYSKNFLDQGQCEAVARSTIADLHGVASWHRKAVRGLLDPKEYIKPPDGDANDLEHIGVTIKNCMTKLEKRWQQMDLNEMLKTKEVNENGRDS